MKYAKKRVALLWELVETEPEEKYVACWWSHPTKKKHKIKFWGFRA